MRCAVCRRTIWPWQNYSIRFIHLHIGEGAKWNHLVAAHYYPCALNENVEIENRTTTLRKE